MKSLKVILSGIILILEPIQDLPVRRTDGYFFVLQGTKTQFSLYGLQVFVTPQDGKRPVRAACGEILNRLLASLFFLGLCILSGPDSSGPEGIALALFVLGLIVSSFGLFFVKEG